MDFLSCFIGFVFFIHQETFSSPLSNQPDPQNGQVPTLLYSFDYVKFAFPNPQDAEAYINNGTYQNCILAGVKMSNSGVMYANLPRWKSGVPATLTKIIERDGEILLDAFPSWEMNKIGDVNALQSVTGFEIDSRDWMWIIDQGKVDSKMAERNSIKIVIYDLKTEPPSLVQRYSFPETVAPLEHSFLEDLVVDESSNTAFITDSGLSFIRSSSIYGGMIVYDMDNNRSRRVLDYYHNEMSTQADNTLWIEINEERVYVNTPINTGADGIALCHANDINRSVVYYCPLTSHNLYSIPTAILRNFSIEIDQLGSYVSKVGNKGSASDGLACANNGLLYMTMLEENSITAFDDTSKTISLITKNDSAMVWPDRIGFDHKGNLLFVTNKMHYFVQNMMTWTNDTANFCVWSVAIGAGSYLDPIPKPSFFSSLDVTSVIIISSAAIVAVCAGYFVGYCQRRKPSNKGISISHHNGNGNNTGSRTETSGLPYKEVNEEGVPPE